MEADVTAQRVLQDIRNTGTKENFERVHFIDWKDLQSILQDFKIGHMARLHPDDDVSVDLLIQKLTEDEKPSPVLHYNNTNCDFSLIIMTEFQQA